MNALPRRPDPAIPFPGSDRLIAQLDAAVALGGCATVVEALRHGMCTLIRDDAVQLPACVQQPVDGHYARRELYRSPQHGYSVVAMTWGPGQGTPLHDHDGLWCVEGVWHGQLEIVQYELLQRDGERFRFRRVDSTTACIGSAGCLIPPHEYHTIRNVSDTAIAVSLHVYKSAMLRATSFQPEHDDWYRRHAIDLATDA